MMPKVLLFTNSVAPYRLPVFEALAKIVDLHVVFAQERAADRRWDTQLHEFTFRHTILAHRCLKLGSASQLINPGLVAFLAQHEFDVVVLGDNRQTLISGSTIGLAALARRWPLVVWTGATPGQTAVARSSGILRGLLAVYQRVLRRQASAVVAYGSLTQRHLRRQGVRSGKVFAGSQVVPASQLPAPTADKGTLGLDGRNVVLSVNYFIPRKGLDVLIRAFRQVAGPRDALVLVGSGPEEVGLKELALGDERILFPGYLDGAGKTAYYAAADIFAFPTLHDPWGLVVNEAMAFGLPVVATDAAGCVHDLVGDNGLVVPPGNAEELAGALARLLADEALRARMGQRSREIIADYTVATARNTFMQAIEHALSQR